MLQEEVCNKRQKLLFKIAHCRASFVLNETKIINDNFCVENYYLVMLYFCLSLETCHLMKLYFKPIDAY